MTDFKGQELSIGDTVAFIGNGHSPDLWQGTIIGFTEHYIVIDRTNFQRKKTPSKVVKLN